jgi:1,2-dihydroxy-3-keto-5-methylthiopentene dioxygenase
MTVLTMFNEDGAERLRTEDGAEIARLLAGIGVRFERREAEGLEAALREEGYTTIDTVSVTPDHPDREAMRGKFLSEHRHAEDEVRFFIDGSGLFTLREQGHVYAVLCTAGDLISVPAGMRHWFDMGPRPSFTAMRFFRTPDGWVGDFTGDPIADRFPRLEPA